MPTALVTGPTSGIGRAFARHYAEAGHDLVLVSRDAGRLTRTAGSLASGNRVSVEVLAVDLATRRGTDLVASRLADPGREVDVLVNSAGFGLGTPFAENSVDDEQRLLDVLVVAVLRLTHAALRVMIPRGRGDIVNVSSVAGFTTRGTYAAHKAWVTSFTRSLSLRHRGDGLRIMALCPGYVRTEFHQRMGARTDMIPPWMWLDADRLVKAAVEDLAKGAAVSIPSRRYQVLAALARHAPGRVVAKVSGTGR